MRYYIIPRKKKVIAWSPKCASTTIKALIALDLGYKLENHKIDNKNALAYLHKLISAHPYIERMHNKDGSLKHEFGSTKYEVIGSPFIYENTFDIVDDSYDKICIVRNPYDRFISGITDRSRYLKHGAENQKRRRAIKSYNMIKDLTVEEYIVRLKENRFKPDQIHFQPQTIRIKENIVFDKVYDVGDIDSLINNHFPDQENKKYGNHDVTYDDSIKTNYSKMKISEITELESFSKDPSQWFSAESIKIINELYKDDFTFCAEHGIHYDLL